MKKKLNTLAAVSLLLALASCGSSEPSPSGVSYTEKTVSAQIYKKGNDGQTVLRFYQDMPKIPYMGISRYYKLLLNQNLQVKKGTDGLFTLTPATEAPAVVDVKKDTLSAEDFQEFINTTIYRDPSLPNIYYDGVPFVQYDRIEVDQKPLPITIDFAKYHIDVREDGDEVYFPFITLSDLFKGVTMVQSYFDGEKVYVVDSNSAFDSGAYAAESSVNTNITNAYFADGKRDRQVADYAYNELCFAIDTFYGLPGREKLHRELIAYGLDKALDVHSELSRTVKTLLKSSDADEYLAGLYLMDQLLGDGGHTVIGVHATSYIVSVLRQQPDRYQKVVDLITKNQIFNERAEKSAIYSAVFNAKADAFGDFDDYHESGDTAMFTFDAFDYNLDEWTAYFAAKESERVLPHDAVGNFVRACEKAKASGKIKNMVLDLTMNGGGSADIVMYLLQAMSGHQAYFMSRDTVTHQTKKTYYKVDTNLDGVFDAKDLKKPYDFNFALLDSGYSFSCGNLLPLLAKENGILLLGDKTGGGACAVFDGCTADGLYYRYSSCDHMLDAKGNSGDHGIYPHYYLLDGDQTNPSKKNYARFFDFSTLSTCFHEFYGANA